MFPALSLRNGKCTPFIESLIKLIEVFKKLQVQMITTGNESNEITNALKYRASVVKDSLAAARWESWLKKYGNKCLPNLPSLLNAGRHLLLRNKRYHIAKTTGFHDLND
jgi:hypothetical protein